MGYAYTAKTGISVSPPPGWPRYWPWPPPNPPVPPYPPDWPDEYTDNYTITVDMPSAIDVEAYAQAVTVTLLLDDADTDNFDGYTLRLTAAIDDEAVELAFSANQAKAAYLDVTVSNYETTKYGWTGSVWFDLEAGDAGSTLTLTAELLLVSPELTGSDTAVVAYAWSIDEDAACVNCWTAWKNNFSSKFDLTKWARLEHPSLIFPPYSASATRLAVVVPFASYEVTVTLSTHDNDLGLPNWLRIISGDTLDFQIDQSERSGQPPDTPFEKSTTAILTADGSGYIEFALTAKGAAWPVNGHHCLVKSLSATPV